MHLHLNRISFFLGLIIVSLSVIAPQFYLAQNPQVHLDLTIFVEAVLIPVILASVFFLGGGRRIVWFAFMAYIWSITEDAPVYLDSVFTWPEVTSGLQHLFLEVVIHLLTLLFMFLTIREAFRIRKQRFLVQRGLKQHSGNELVSRPTRSKLLLIYGLTLVAFISSYAQNLPLSSFESITGASWYGLDIVEHVISIGLLYAAVRLTLNLPPHVATESPPNKFG